MATRRRSTEPERARGRRQPALTIVQVPLAKLKPDPGNPRRITTAARARLEQGLAHFGHVQPIVARLSDGLIVGGHQRYVIALAQGDRTVPVVYVDLANDAETRALNLLLNNPDAQGRWDLTRLGAVLGELQLAKLDLSLTGFDESSLAKYLRPATREERAERLPSTPAKPKSHAGEIYELGPHRLVCGKAEDTALVQRAIGSAKAACVFTDPPYGVSYEARSGKHAKITGDEQRRDQLAVFLGAAFATGVACAESAAAWYIFHASSTRHDFEQAMLAVGLVERQYLVWAKPAIALGWADYRWAHEPCFYAALAGQEPAWHGDRGQGTVWRFEPRMGGHTLHASIGSAGLILSDGRGTELYLTTKVPAGVKRHLRVAKDQRLQLVPESGQDDLWEVSREPDAAHPTQKPIALAKRALTNSTAPGETVLDLFAGSGNLLLAAELLGRRAVAVELDRGYCDVIRQRYADFTGDARWSPTKRLTDAA